MMQSRLGEVEELRSKLGELEDVHRRLAELEEWVDAAVECRLVQGLHLKRGIRHLRVQ